MSHKHNLWNQTLNSKEITGLKSRLSFPPHCHRLHLLEELLYSEAEKKNQRRYACLGKQLRKETLGSLCSCLVQIQLIISLGNVFLTDLETEGTCKFRVYMYVM